LDDDFACGVALATQIRATAELMRNRQVRRSEITRNVDRNAPADNQDAVDDIELDLTANIGQRDEPRRHDDTNVTANIGQRDERRGDDDTNVPALTDLLRNVDLFETGDDEGDADGLFIDLTATNRQTSDSAEPLGVAQPAVVAQPAISGAERVKKWSAERLLGLLLLRGSYHLSKRQYMLISAILQTKSGGFLPSWSELHTKTRPMVHSYCLPKATRETIPPEWCSSKTRPNTNDNVLVIIPPSRWAIHDVTYGCSFKKIYETLASDDLRSIESTNIIRNRQSITNPESFFYIETGGEHMRVHRRDQISIEFRSPRLVRQFFVHDISITSFGSTDSLDATSNRRAAVRALLRFSSIRPTDIPSNQILPGDMCVLLSPDSAEDERTNYCVLVKRFWKHSKYVQETTLFLEFSLVRAQNRPYALTDIRPLDVASISMHMRGDNHREIDQAAPLQGILSDGRKFLVYRIMLYADDFDPFKSTYSRGQVGGVYMMPVGLPTQDKFSPSSIRCISLAPLAVSSNVVLAAIMNDLLQGATEGFPVCSPDGEQVQLFLDVVGFVSDYPACAKLLDSKGVTGLAPCTHCTIQQFAGQDFREASKHGYTTSIHSKNSCSMRSVRKHRAMHDAGISEDGHKRLGINDSDISDPIRCPFHFFQKELHERRDRIPKTMDNRPVVPHHFCPYQSQVIGPDHVLNGVICNSINACAFVLPQQKRLELDRRIRYELQEHGLPRQTQVFKHEGVESTKFHVHSNSFSDTSAIFAILPPILRVMYQPYLSEHAHYKTLLDMIEELHALVGLTYYWPQPAVDPEEDYQYIIGSERKQYHADLLSRARKYISYTDSAAKVTEEVKSYIDKPNVHRVLELYIHTIPAYGHVRHVIESPFEHAHQALKRVWEQHNSRQNHISVVEEMLWNDFFHRLFLCRKGIRQNSCENPTQAQTSSLNNYRKEMRMLLLGLDLGLPASESEWPSLDTTIASLFSPEVDKGLEYRANQKMNRQPSTEWVSMVPDNLSIHAVLSSDTTSFIAALRGILDIDDCTDLLFFKYASRSSHRIAGTCDTTSFIAAFRGIRP